MTDGGGGGGEMSAGDVATAILKTIMRRGQFEQAGVPDTPYNRGVWARMKADVDNIPADDIVDLPHTD